MTKLGETITSTTEMSSAEKNVRDAMASERMYHNDRMTVATRDGDQPVQYIFDTFTQRGVQVLSKKPKIIIPYENVADVVKGWK